MTARWQRTWPEMGSALTTLTLSFNHRDGEERRVGEKEKNPVQSDGFFLGSSKDLVIDGAGSAIFRVEGSVFDD